MNTCKNENGFSLIELMVVVAIIGILSAVAVPQFQKFQRKAKQSEAKAMLSGIYTAQKIFLAETGSYYSNLWATGFEPEGLMNYNSGFGASSGANMPGYTAYPYRHTDFNSTAGICSSSWSGGPGDNCMYPPSTALAIPTGPVASASAFTVWARVSASVLGGSSEDRWSIDHRKELINLINGAL